MKTKGLTLIEAVNSGQKFKRKKWSWFRAAEDMGALIDTQSALAADYELEPEAELLTREEVRQAALKVMLPLDNAAFHKAEKICYELFGPEEA